MFQKICVLISFVFLIFFHGALSLKAENKAPKTKTSSPTAQLYRVDEGLFDIRLGDVLDLTDNKILMAFPVDRNSREAMVENKSIKIKINNISFGFTPGQRLNFKGSGYANYIDKYFKDYSECFIDLIGVTVPKGAPAIATFRLHCE